jgi:glycogen debranching enzyme
MLHYTPLQQRGESDSPYSIMDQLVYDPSLFGGQTLADGGKNEVEKILKLAKDKYGLLSLTDVVLNHTANNSPWLLEHPEAGLCLIFSRFVPTDIFLGYSPANTPHLRPALELDTAILDFSGSLKELGLPTSVNSEKDLDSLINGLRTKVKGLNLWQYYVLDVTRERENIRAVLSQPDRIVPWTGQPVAGKSVVELSHIVRAAGKIEGLAKFGSRFGVHVDPAIAAGLVKAAFTELEEPNPDKLAEAWIRIVDVLNVPLYEEFNDDIRVALDNVKNRVKYTRFEEGGPKLGEISRE